MDQAEREADARNAEGAGAMDVEEEEEDNPETVSYTHLTLPTKA